MSNIRRIDDARGDRPGRRPPHNLQAEESLLGAMMLKKDVIGVASERLQPEDFYKPAHGHIYEAITSLAASGQPADPVTIADELKRAGLLDAIGGHATLLNLQAGTPSTSSAGRYTQIIEDHSLLRRLIAAAGDIAESAYDLPDDVPTTVDRAEATIFNLARRRSDSGGNFVGDLLDAGLDRLEQLYEKGQTVTGLGTGFTDLDELTSGLQPGALYVLGARPSMGKTALALNIAAHVAIEKTPVLVFSLEMGELELTNRVLCAEARVDSKRLRNGRVTEKDWGNIAHASGRLADIPLCIDDNPDLTIMGLRAKARRFKSRYPELGLIVVDYVQLMTGRSGTENRQLEISEISRGLKLLARELEVPVVALSQLSRKVEDRADKRPMLSDLRESGSQEQDADVVLFVYRDEVYRTDSPDSGTAEIIVAKHRNGPVGIVRLGWLGHHTKFVNLAKGA